MKEERERVRIYVDELTERYPVLDCCRNAILQSYHLIDTCYRQGGKLLIAGNGGSAADSEHMVGELMKGFCNSRRIDRKFAANLIKVGGERGSMLAAKLQGALPAIALTNHVSLNTAVLNDMDGILCFSQQLVGYGNKGDILVVISTSGNSENILCAAVTARAKDMGVIALTGSGGGKLKDLSDICINVNEQETFKIQELHLPIYHCLCRMLEDSFFGDKR